MTPATTQTTNERSPEAAVDTLFLERWSRRAFADADIPADQLASVFEAARWAASCYNDQPWHFRYATRGNAMHEQAAGVLVDANRAWAEAAPVLGVVFARRKFGQRDQVNDWAQFDTGAASAQMALQASLLGLSVHYMAGFEEEKAYEVFGLDRDEWKAMAGFAIGVPGDKSTLPDKLAEREQPSPRKPLAEVAKEVRS